jgi:hypothetical protein
MPAFAARAVFRIGGALFVALVSVSGCGGEDPTDPEDPGGVIQVAVSTSGDDPDPDGYLATLDGAGTALPLPVTGSTSFPNVAAGEHTVALSGLVSHCTADAASKSVTVVAGATATVSFTVSCSAIPPTVGSIRVITSTIGSNPDADGYQFAIDDGPAQAIGITSTATVNDVAPGAHRVVLSGVAANCGLSAGTSKDVTVTAGETADAVFTVTCHVMGPSESESHIQVDPATISITTTSIITVTVVDASGTPLPGMEVTVNATGTGNTISPWPSVESRITNASGVATFSFGSTVPEAKTITAAANAVTLEHTQVITVIKGLSSTQIRNIVPEPSTSGETFLVTVGIIGERGGIPTAGTVAVSSNLEPDAGCDAAPVSSDGQTTTATCEMSLSIVSTHMLDATYSGDSQFEGSSNTVDVEHVVIAPEGGIRRASK